MAHLIIVKSRRTLAYYRENRLCLCYPVALGRAPLGPKAQAGDGRTPEGNYRICLKKRDSKYFRSLGLSYPGPEDAQRALEAGLITRTQWEAVLEAFLKDQRPPWGTPLGGEIFIHGGGDAGDWTEGCVALDDAHMEVLFECAQLGDRVEILP